MTYARLRQLAIMEWPCASLQDALDAFRGLPELLADLDRVIAEKDAATREIAILKQRISELESMLDATEIPDPNLRGW